MDFDQSYIVVEPEWGEDVAVVKYIGQGYDQHLADAKFAITEFVDTWGLLQINAPKSDPFDVLEAYYVKTRGDGVFCIYTQAGKIGASDVEISWTMKRVDDISVYPLASPIE